MAGSSSPTPVLMLSEAHIQTIEGLREDMASVRATVGKTEQTLVKMADAVERLARLEERHANTSAALERAFTAIESQDKRIAALEREAPMQRTVSLWVTNLMYGAAGMVLMAMAHKAGLV